MRNSQNRVPRLHCSFCGAEIASGAPYWYINGAIICPDCLPEFAREDYRACRQIHGEEDVL